MKTHSFVFGLLSIIRNKALPHGKTVPASANLNVGAVRIAATSVSQKHFQPTPTANKKQIVKNKELLC
jgi:hypothetical protein